MKRTLEGLPGVAGVTIRHHRAYIDFAFQTVTLEQLCRTGRAPLRGVTAAVLRD